MFWDYCILDYLTGSVYAVIRCELAGVHSWILFWPGLFAPETERSEDTSIRKLYHFFGIQYKHKRLDIFMD